MRYISDSFREVFHQGSREPQVRLGQIFARRVLGCIAGLLCHVCDALRGWSDISQVQAMGPCPRQVRR